MPPTLVPETTTAGSIPPGRDGLTAAAADARPAADVVREVLAREAGATGVCASGWVMRRRTTSPLDTRFITR